MPRSRHDNTLEPSDATSLSAKGIWKRSEEETHHAPKPLLSRSVPKLEPDLEATHMHLLRYEKRASRGKCRYGVERVARISLQKTSLPHTYTKQVRSLFFRSGTETRAARRS